MANKKHLEILRQGVEKWNKWRKNNPDVKPDLSGANLKGLDLKKADFNGTDVRGHPYYMKNIMVIRITTLHQHHNH